MDRVCRLDTLMNRAHTDRAPIKNWKVKDEIALKDDVVKEIVGKYPRKQIDW